eukprot:tig00000955_g5814.t1
MTALAAENAGLQARLAEAAEQQQRMTALAAENAGLQARLAEAAEQQQRMTALAAENAGLQARLAEAAEQQQRAAALEAENASLQARLAQAVEGQQRRAAALEAEKASLSDRLSLYEGGAGLANRQWGEAELEEAGGRLKAAAQRVEELRIEARARPLPSLRSGSLYLPRNGRRPLLRSGSSGGASKVPPRSSVQ